MIYGLPQWLSGKESACNAGDVGDVGSIPGSGRSPGGGHGNPLQYPCLENPMDRGAYWATVHGVAKSRTRLSDFHFHSAADMNMLSEYLLVGWSSELTLYIIPWQLRW